MSARYIVGDVFDVLDTLEPASVDLVLSSPPFLALRSYLPADHPDKGKEIGSEATPADFLDTLLDVTEACARVLTPYGSLVFELGDTFAGSGGAGGDYNEGGLRDGQERFNGAAAKARSHAEKPRWRTPDGTGRRQRGADEDAGIPTPRPRPGPNANGRDHMRGWPLDKSLCGIPTLFAWSLAYGRNLLRPERTTDAWRVRNVVAWCRPNPPVGALGDKFRPGTSYLTVACKARDRWFDLDAVRVPFQDSTLAVKTGTGGAKSNASTQDDWREAGSVRLPERQMTHAGAPPLDWWEIPTQPYKGSHYATWPEKLLVRPIEAMCPREVCTTCGQPRRRIVEVDGYVTNDGRPARMDMNQDRLADENVRQFAGAGDNSAHKLASTVGWTDCGHASFRRGVVLDPFAGSGTTLAVAEGLGRDSVGIDLDARNAELAYERCGMFLSVVVGDKLGETA